MTQRSDSHVDITLDNITLDGTLDVPDDASGIVVFAHTSGSNRHSPQNNYVPEEIRNHGLGTLVFDLLTVSEDQNQANQFNTELLTNRLVGAVDWLDKYETGRTPPIGLFGSNTGAAAALQAAAQLGDNITAVVSCGGRVDLASESVAAVESPTLLIVDGADGQLLEVNRAAYKQLGCRTKLHTISGASHLSAAESEHDAIADVAADWFADELQYQPATSA